MLPNPALVVSEASEAAALVRLCVADIARLRGRGGSRWATCDDVFTFLAALGIDTTELSAGCASQIVFREPEWEFDGLYTASMRSKPGTRRLVKMWLLTTPTRARRRVRREVVG